MATPVNALTVGIRCSGNAPVGLMAKTKYSIVALTAGNFAAQNTAATALGNAEAGLTLGWHAADDISIPLFASATYPSVVANRGSKWIVTAANTNGR